MCMLAVIRIKPLLSASRNTLIRKIFSTKQQQAWKQLMIFLTLNIFATVLSHQLARVFGLLTQVRVPYGSQASNFSLFEMFSFQ